MCGCVRRPATARFLWMPSAAFIIVVLFSAFALVRPPQAPADVQRELPLASVAHYTAEDFFSAAR